MGLFDPDEFLLGWLNDIQYEKLLEANHIAINGKSLKNTYAYSKKKYLTHMVNACSVDMVFLVQLKMDSKSNEMTTIPTLPKLIRVKD
ncbi:hypothetical protein A9261_18920 [Vibrio tasmaniensis]|nr:hypothetical protein A9261_18920 [Vibrio tasmaniensis]